MFECMHKCIYIQVYDYAMNMNMNMNVGSDDVLFFPRMIDPASTERLIFLSQDC